MSIVCKCCGEEKLETEYYEDSKARCRKCVDKKRSTKRNQKAQEESNKLIACKECGIEKTGSEYYASYRSTCKDCVKAATKKRKEENPEKKKESDRKWREENKERKKEMDKKWRTENADRKKATDAAYREKNKDNPEFQQKMKESRKNWNKNNPEYFEQPRIIMADKMRRKLHDFIFSVNNIFSEDFGCTTNFYRMWLEFQFDSNMTWGNYGDYWEIDHVIGCSNFGIDEDSLRKCYHWSNTRPLEKTRNKSKNNTVYLHTNVIHSLTVNKFSRKHGFLFDFSFNTYNNEIINELGDKVKLRETLKVQTTTPISNE